MSVFEDTFAKCLPFYPGIRGVHPACELFPGPSDEDFDVLVRDIEADGLLNDLTIDPDGLLLDGRSRLAACYLAAKDVRLKTWKGDPWKYSVAENLARRHLTVGQKAMVAERMLGAIQREAADRQLSGKKIDLPQTLAEGSTKGDSRDHAAAIVGVSHTSVDKAHHIATHAPDVAAAVSAGTTTLEAGYKASRERERSTAGHPVEVVTTKPTTAAKVNGNGKPPSPTAQPTVIVLTVSGRETRVPAPQSPPKFNRTNDSVDWASFTWNPVTGCEHGCTFCYAREIAYSERMRTIYPNKFEPTFLPHRLDCPKNTPKPDKAKVAEHPQDGRVFVCSMADLFGKWVPDEWIKAVFDSCLGTPEWEYLFLTKWPARYATMPLIPRAWYGSSVIRQSDVSRVEGAMARFQSDPSCVRWVSLEPMQEPVKFADLSWCDLMVVGSQTSTNQPDGVGHVPSFAPEFDWVVDVVNQCREFDVPYYLKANLGLKEPGMRLPRMSPRRAAK